MTKECLWKLAIKDEDSTTAEDMVKNPDVKCQQCSGWDEECKLKMEVKK